jgi:hypothetical protein
MAFTLYCDDHHDQPGVALITSLLDGSVATVCAGCFGPWCLAMAQALMPDVFQDVAVTATADAPASGEGEAAQDPPRPKRRRSGRQNGSSANAQYQHEHEPLTDEFASEVPAELSHPASPLRDAAPDHS